MRPEVLAPDVAPEPKAVADRLGDALRTPAGAALLDHLGRRFLERSLPPTTSEAELRHLEGQRSVVVYLRHLVATSGRAQTGETSR